MADDPRRTIKRIEDSFRTTFSDQIPRLMFEKMTLADFHDFGQSILDQQPTNDAVLYAAKLISRSQTLAILGGDDGQPGDAYCGYLLALVLEHLTDETAEATKSTYVESDVHTNTKPVEVEVGPGLAKTAPVKDQDHHVHVGRSPVHDRDRPAMPLDHSDTAAASPSPVRAGAAKRKKSRGMLVGPDRLHDALLHADSVYVKTERMIVAVAENLECGPSTVKKLVYKYYQMTPVEWRRQFGSTIGSGSGAEVDSRS